MLDGFKIPEKASARVKGSFEWDRQKQHELGYQAGFPPSKDTESWVEFSSLTICLSPTSSLSSVRFPSETLCSIDLPDTKSIEEEIGFLSS